MLRGTDSGEAEGRNRAAGQVNMKMTPKMRMPMPLRCPDICVVLVPNAHVPDAPPVRRKGQS